MKVLTIEENRQYIDKLEKGMEANGFVKCHCGNWMSGQEFDDLSECCHCDHIRLDAREAEESLGTNESFDEDYQSQFA